MAERDLILKLRAAGAASFKSDVEGDAQAIRKVGDESRRASSRMERAASRMARIGRASPPAGSQLTRNATAPIAAAGAATVKLAVDFDKGMRNVNSIARLPEAQ